MFSFARAHSTCSVLCFKIWFPSVGVRKRKGSPNSAVFFHLRVLIGFGCFPKISAGKHAVRKRRRIQNLTTCGRW